MPDSDPNPYALGADACVPELPGARPVVADLESVFDALCAELMVRASGTIAECGSFQFGLSLGPITERLIMKLMVDPKYRSMPWDQTKIWSLRDPLVSPDDPVHSLGSLRELLVEPAGLDEDQFQVIQAHRTDACEAASEALRSVLSNRSHGFHRLDAAVLECDTMWVGEITDPVDRLFTQIGNGDGARIALTTRVINGAGFIGVLGSGDQQWDVIRNIERGEIACALNPISGTLRWFLDDESEQR